MIDLSKILNIDWDYLNSNYTWFSDMKYVEQDIRYHAEGNVEIHTKRVYLEMVAIINNNNLNEIDSIKLLLAALFHDVEKRSTTFIDTDGTIIAPGHAKKGEYTVRNFLYKNSTLKYIDREYICKLVRWHGLPLWHGEDINKTILEVSQLIKMQHLYYLSLADVLGRDCNDKDDLLLKLEIFKEECINLNCWNNAYHFESNVHRFNVINNDKPLSYIPYITNKPVIYLLSGLPGSGKDYYIKKNLDNLECISLDDIRRELGLKNYNDKKLKGRAIQLAFKRIKTLLSTKKDFVLNSTNISKDFRKTIVNLSEIYKYNVNIIYIEVTYKQLLIQNKNRKYPIPENELEKLIKRLNPPTINECYNLDLIVT